MSHKQGGIAETVRKCNGELLIKLATIVVALALVAKQWEKAHWYAGMCRYQHSHWALIRLRKPNALFKSCWMLCIFCSWSYRGACFQFVPPVRHQSAYFDTFTGIFRKCKSANAFWTRYLETVIGWRFRIVQKGIQMRCLLHHILSLIAYTFRENRDFVFNTIVQFMMISNIIRLFVYNTISFSSLCKLIWRHWTYKMPVRYILSSVSEIKHIL